MRRVRTVGRAKKILIGAAVLCVALACLAAGPGLAGSANADSNLPLVVTNNSGLNEPAYIYIIGTNASGQLGYVDANGNFNPWSYPGSIPNGPVPTPAFGINGPATGSSETLYLPPDIAGGRMYMSFGQQLPFSLTTSGLVEPAPWINGDPSKNILFDWVEFARYAPAGIFINTTMVDMFSVPLSVSVTAANGSTQTEGQLVPGGRASIFNQIKALGGDWPNLIYTDPSTGMPLRVISPAHGVANGVFSSTYLDSYVSGVWSYYSSHSLTVSTGSATYTGTVSAGAWTFTDSSGNMIGSLGQPSTSDVLGCSGPLQPSGQPNESAILAVGAIVCAALNRGTLSTPSFAGSDSQPTTNPATFYTQSTSNLYSAVMHANEVDGKAYGFPYDDVAGFDPSINVATPQSASVTVQPFTGGGGGGGGDGGGGGGTGATGPITGYQGLCVDVRGANSADYTPVQVYTCNGTIAQQWTVVEAGTTLRALGKCMDINGGGTANGTTVDLYTCNDTGAQVFIPQSNGSLYNPQSNKCLDDTGWGGSGTQLQIWDCTGNANQQWHLP